MRNGLITLVARDSSTSSPFTMATLVIVLLVLMLVALICTAALLVFRYQRRRRELTEGEHGLPLYNDSRPSSRSNHRRITIKPTESIYVYREKCELMDNFSTPSTPVPEIRITFPEELDEGGKRQSGRVVVVHVGENGVGMSPVTETEKLPSYQQTESDRFQSLDLDRIGGLHEKELEARWQ